MRDGQLVYTVSCTFTNAAVAEQWMAWLIDEHLADVCNAGATDGEIIDVDRDDDSADRTIEVRYHFPDRATFDAYVRDHAPRLRDEGLRRFPLELGLTYQRSIGICRGSLPPKS